MDSLQDLTDDLPERQKRPGDGTRRSGAAPLDFFAGQLEHARGIDDTQQSAVQTKPDGAP